MDLWDADADEGLGTSLDESPGTKNMKTIEGGVEGSLGSSWGLCWKGWSLLLQHS